MPDKCVDFVFTDPPYNLGKDYGIYQDDLSEEEYVLKMNFIIKELRRLSKKGIGFYVNSKRALMFWNLLPESKGIIIKKGAISTPTKDYYRQWCVLLVTRKPNELIYDLWADIRLPGEGYFFKEPRYPHPGLTSQRLTERVFKYFTEEKEIILDPFMGTGTTARVAKDFKRYWIGIEINSDYCDMSKKRLAQGVL